MTMTADALRQAVRPPRETPPDCGCAALSCAGWESVAGPQGAPVLERIGTLRPAGDEEPTLDEHHPAGTRLWSADAPVATAFFPYNRCEVWRCVACGRGFVQYTEYGGYYVDHRIREIDPALVV
jgi:hypothetical protein